MFSLTSHYCAPPPLQTGNEKQKSSHRRTVFALISNCTVSQSVLLKQAWMFSLRNGKYTVFESFSILQIELLYHTSQSENLQIRHYSFVTLIFTCSEIARKRQEASLATAFRNSPKLPKYSSIDASLRDFWPQYFFHPLCIVHGMRRKVQRGEKEEKKCPFSLFRQIIAESADDLITLIHLNETRLKIFYPYQGKYSWVIKGLKLVNVTPHCL